MSLSFLEIEGRSRYNIGMKAALFLTSAFSLALLSSCSFVKRITTPGEYHPEYMNEGSALDGPGAQAARDAQRNELVQEGSFAPGDVLDVQESKVYLFSRNPDKNQEVSGKMVTTDKAKIISCEGLYYFVEVDDGTKGFLRESDLVNPVKLVATDGFLLPGGETPGPEGWAEGDIVQPEEVQLDSNQTLMTNAHGRTVVVVGKKTEKSEAFEARRKAIMEGGPAPDAAPAPTPEPAYEELPEPTAGY